MCVFSKPKIKPVDIPTPEKPPSTVDAGDQAAMAASAEQRRKRLAAAQADTMVTGAQGIMAPAQTAGKRLFGQ